MREIEYELELFAGAGGGILGGMLCGHTCIGAVEIEEYPKKVLLQRQRDGILPHFPIWDDVTTFRSDNPECAEYIELLRSIRQKLVIKGGFPCQDISAAGKGAGITKTSRSGLWFEFARIINEVRPAGVLVENSPILTSRGIGIVLGDLAEMGYNAKWGVLGAVDVGAPHKRERIWIMADSNGSGCTREIISQPKEWREETESTGTSQNFSDSEKVRCQREWQEGNSITKEDGGEKIFERNLCDRDLWSIEPQLGRVANGVAYRVDRLEAIGNGQVPAVVECAWEVLG